MRAILSVVACLSFSVPVLAQSLIINEIDYDQPGTDTDEFVEIKNTSLSPVNLADLSLAFINGANNTEYLRVSLAPAGMLFPGRYLVVCSSTVAVAAGASRINFVTGTNQIQNGAPDAVVIINTATTTLIHSFCYEGAMPLATIAGFPGTYNLVNGTFLPVSVADSNAVPGSLARVPDGLNTGIDAADWSFVGVPTPGAPNSGLACPADFNGDQQVDDSDFVIFALNYDLLTVPPANAACDLSGDGLVEDADFVLFAAAYDALVCP